MADRKWKDDVEAAMRRIERHIRHTPLDQSLILSEMSQGQVYFKLESEQITGSFKLRGACNKLVMLQESGQLTEGKGPVLASTGNHAMACNHLFKSFGLRGTTYVPTNISPAKEDSLRRYKAEVVKVGTDCVDGEREARRVSEAEGRPYISPYNDFDVIAGQGTIGFEIIQDLPDVDAVFVSVGGGGLIGGIASYIKSVKPTVKIVGCTPRNSKVMYESVKAGKVVFEESLDTLSDGTAGALEDGCVTFELCRDLVDEWVLVTEEQIADAVYFMAEHQHKIVEGATGVSLGAFLQTSKDYEGKNVVIIACGANIGINTLKQVLNRK